MQEHVWADEATCPLDVSIGTHQHKYVWYLHGSDFDHTCRGGGEAHVQWLCHKPQLNGNHPHSQFNFKVTVSLSLQTAESKSQYYHCQSGFYHCPNEQWHPHILGTVSDYIPLTSFKEGQLPYTPVEWFTWVSNWAATHIITHLCFSTVSLSSHSQLHMCDCMNVCKCVCMCTCERVCAHVWEYGYDRSYTSIQ